MYLILPQLSVVTEVAVRQVVGEKLVTIPTAHIGCVFRLSFFWPSEFRKKRTAYSLFQSDSYPRLCVKKCLKHGRCQYGGDGVTALTRCLSPAEDAPAYAGKHGNRGVEAGEGL